VTPTNYQYEPGNVLRYGTNTTPGTTDMTTAIQAAINVAKAAGGGIVYIPIGTYKITAALTYTATGLSDSIIFQGEGSQANGSVISNITNDVETIYINGVVGDSGKRVDRVVFRDLRILHKAATKYALVSHEAPYMFGLNAKFECDSVGYGCIFLGNTTVVPDSDNFLTSWTDCEFRGYVTTGVRINSQGSTIHFDNCKCGSGATATHDYWIQTEGVHIRGGQSGGANLGVYFDNMGAGDIEYGSLTHNKFEGVATGQIGMFVTGTNATPRDFAMIHANHCAVNMAANDGVIFKFDYARQCVVDDPSVRNPTSGTGKLMEWAEHSDQCELRVNYEGAQAAITVHASALRATKRVTGRIARSQVTNITTNSNLTTILQDGVDDLPPGFVPVHSRGAWNYWLQTLTDDTAASFTPPSTMGRLRLMEDDEISTAGEIRYDCRGAGAVCTLVSGGGDLEVTTGVLAGTTGTNNKITVSAHTDGKIYIEARKGTANITVLFESTIWSV
jgi:hypothetical protein